MHLSPTVIAESVVGAIFGLYLLFVVWMYRRRAISMAISPWKVLKDHQADIEKAVGVLIFYHCFLALGYLLHLLSNAPH